MKKLISAILTVFILTTNVGHAVGNEERNLLYKVVEAECTGASYESKVKVANVIFNRVNNPSYPNTIKGVIYAKGQFSVISDGRVNRVSVTPTTVKAVDDALQGKWLMSDMITYFNMKGLNSYAKRNHLKWKGYDEIHDFFYQTKKHR